MGRQEQINAFSESSALTDPAVIEGTLNYLSWRGDEPWLYFLDSPPHFQGFPLATLLNEEVTIEVGQHQRCGNCGEPANSTPCSECSNLPPFATCIQQPGTYCTYQNCPFETYKRQSCSNQFVVYLTATDRIKVGITGASRLTARLRKQAATHGVALAKVKNRRAAGVIEDEIGRAAPLLTEVLNCRFAKQINQSWSDPLQTPVKDLVTATIMAETYIPDRLRKGYLHSDNTREEISDAVEPLPALSASPDGFPHHLVNSLKKVDPYESTRGRFIGVRGALLTTSQGYVNTQRLQGHRLTIRTEAPLVDQLEEELRTGIVNQDKGESQATNDGTESPAIPAAEFM